MQAKLTLTFDQPISFFVLVMGGWYPLVFVQNCVLALDRNILKILHHLEDGSKRQDVEKNRWWLKFLDTESVTLNPVLCALEGENRSVPTKEEFTVQFNEATIRIKKFLPRARIIEYTDAHFGAAYEMLSHLSERYDAECQFLLSVAPIISCRKRGADLKRAHSKIIANCEQLGLSKTSLILICTLSCLYERNDGAEPLIGRNIIKPCELYSNEDAHNAISDLRALEMLAAINGLNIGCVSFCTRDKYLAAMWCGLKVSSPKWSGNQFTCSINPDVSLFPRLTESDVSDLVGELNNS